MYHSVYQPVVRDGSDAGRPVSIQTLCMPTSGVIPDCFCGDESPTVVDFARSCGCWGTLAGFFSDRMAPLVRLQRVLRHSLDFLWYHHRLGDM